MGSAADTECAALGECQWAWLSEDVVASRNTRCLLRGGKDCFVFIVGLSIPLSAMLILMLRRGYSLRPNLMGVVGGLAVAAASATLLNLFHPYDAAATDLTVHATAVAVVILANQLLAYRFAKRENYA